MKHRVLHVVPSLVCLLAVGCNADSLDRASNAAGASAGAKAPNNAAAPANVSPIAAVGPADQSDTLDYFAGMKNGATQFEAVCARGARDRFSAVYCASSTPPAITSMDSLLDLFGIRTGINQGQPAANQQIGGAGLGRTNGFNFALNSQNASLVSRDTSVLNPRAIIYNSNAPFLAFGFTRGSDLVEIAAMDPNTKDINFFLLHYQHACDTTNTCTNLDRFGPANESNWINVDVYSGHEDLVNTVRQCDTCHRPGGFNYTADTGAKSILRMQQLVNPWTTWFRSDRGGSGLVAQFCAAHTNEEYAGIPYDFICDAPGTKNPQAPQNRGGNPQRLQVDMVQAGNFDKDPNIIIYQGDKINNDKATFVGPPNTTWTGFFAQMLKGQIIHIPHFEIDAYDTTKVSAASASYVAAVGGKAAPSTAPDLTAAPLLLADAPPYIGHQGISVNPVNGQPATGTDVVNQMCATCHAGVFPGAGNRENFKVADYPDNLTADEKLKVANRVCRPASSIYLMPPLMFGDLTDANKALILTDLGFAATCPSED